MTVSMAIYTAQKRGNFSKPRHKFREYDMSDRDRDEDLGECRKIEVIATPAGWLVTEEGLLKGCFGNIEDAYLKALTICATLFDEGTLARVFQTNPTTPYGPNAPCPQS
jgi:hypothetical protein